jgi:hypothetical protein
MRYRVIPVLGAGLLVLLLVWILLAPAETRLGSLVKLVYVHGALVWSGLFVFSLAGIVGLVALVMRHVIRSSDGAKHCVLGVEATSLAALIVWIVYVISAMVVTGVTWGQIIAWNEPRVRATGLILVAAVILFVVARLVDQPDFAAVVSVLMGIVPWIVVRQADVIRHPVNPIGGSESAAIQGFYWLIVLTVAGLATLLVAWLWIGAELGSRADNQD